MLRRFAELAKTDDSPLVRLYMASALQRVPVPSKRWDAVTALFAHAEDATDQNQPLMVWYAAEPRRSPLDMPRALALAADSKLPRIFTFTVQRIAGLKTQEALKVLAERLARTTGRRRAEGAGRGNRV